MDTIRQKFSWLRLIAAISVAFIASLAWLGLYSEYFGIVGPYFGNVLLGFFGVLAGSFCFHRRHRFLGSLILFAGGVALDLLFEGSDDKVYPLSVVWVALGGLLPVAFCFWRRPANNSLQATAAPPASCD
jgi:hypothetical protein